LKLVIVIDANVIVSALFGGVPRQAVIRALKEDVCLSPEIEAELTALKERLRKKLSFREIRYWTEAFLPSLLRKMRRTEVPPRLKLCRDPQDDAYLSLAKSVRADYLVTGDQDLLSLSASALESVGLSHLTIATPRRFLWVM
jgi:putative PIN family toxin of toxin-antitoxin system